jgi:hypothetical protein
MFDGIKLNTQIQDIHAWMDLSGIELRCVVDAKTGKIKESKRITRYGAQSIIVYSGQIDNYQIKIKAVTFSDNIHKVTYYLTLRGSFHKNFLKENYSYFKWIDLQKEIQYLENRLEIPASQLSISNLEIGANVSIPFNFSYFERNLLSYKGARFKTLDSNRNRKLFGFKWDLSQYSLKMYDKTAQYDLNYDLMRFELHYYKMEIANRLGIYTLLDLKDYSKVKSLSPLLLKAWDNVFLIDDEVKTVRIKDSQKALLKVVNDESYWKDLKQSNLKAFYYKRSAARKLFAELGKNYHGLIRDRIMYQCDAF